MKSGWVYVLRKLNLFILFLLSNLDRGLLLALLDDLFDIYDLYICAAQESIAEIVTT